MAEDEDLVGVGEAAEAIEVPAEPDARECTPPEPAPQADDWDILILWQIGPGPRGSLVRPLVHEIIQSLGGLGAQRVPGSRIDVWLDSPGGDAHAAYKLGLYLQEGR